MSFFLSAACGDIHSLDSRLEPLVTLRAQVEGQLPGNYSADLLLASLIWENQPQELIDCLERAQTQEEVYACTSLKEGFHPAHASNSVSIQPKFPASLELPIYFLPDPAVLSGVKGSRLGYGILVVYEDGNLNMELDLVPPGAIESYDTILASSRPTDVNQRNLVIYREGKLSPLWKLFEYPPYGCPEPPQGFSVLIRDWHASSGYSCTLSPALEATIPVQFEDSESLKQFICEPQTDFDTFPHKPPPPDREVKCHFHDALEFVMDPTWYCKYKQFYQLAGCEAYFGCQEPEWDLTDNPPDWWPCTGESDNGFTISDHPDELTPVADELFYIRYDSGDELYPMNEIEVWLLWSAEEVLILTQAFPRSILLIGNDGDSLFSQGDTLEIFEPVLSNLFDAEHQGMPYKVILQHSLQPLEPIETLAKLTWISPAQ